MIEIISLEFENIGLFIDRQHISFIDKKNLIQVLAERSDYNGSSGSGKSTIFHAIDYVLGINQIPASALQSRKTKEGIEVCINILWDGSPVSILRSKKNGLTLKGTDPKSGTEFSISGNVELAEEKIDEIIGLPRDVFKKMIHKTQKEGGFFLNLTPSESYKFLVKALKLESWFNKEIKAGELVSAIQNSIDKKELEISFKEPQLTALESTKNDLQKQIDGLVTPAIRQPKDLSILKANKDGLEQELKQALEKVNLKKPTPPPSTQLDLSDLENEKKSIQKKESEELQLVTAKLMELQKAAHEGRLAVKTVSLLNKQKNDKVQEILSIKKKIDHASRNNCPTCHQDWQNDSIAAYISNLKSETVTTASDVKTLTIEIDSLNEKINNSKGLDLQIEELTNQANSIKSHYKEKISAIELNIKEKISTTNSVNNELNKSFQNTLAAWHAEFQDVRERYSKEIALIKESIASSESYNNMIQIETNSYESQKNILTENLKKAIVNYNEIDLQVNNMKNDLKELKYKLEVTKETKMAIKSFLNKTFQDTLDQIGAEATLKLSKIPNASTSTIQFESFKEVKGKIKEEVTALISINGDENINIKTLSGGERSSIDGAIDLSVFQTIEERSGIGANWIVLDEPFEGLDTQSRLDYIELLKESNSNKKIIIVDHTNEVKELAEETIKVIRENDRSFIQ